MAKAYAKPAKGVYRLRFKLPPKRKWIGTAAAAVVVSTRRRQAWIT